MLNCICIAELYHFFFSSLIFSVGVLRSWGPNSPNPRVLCPWSIQVTVIYLSCIMHTLFYQCTECLVIIWFCHGQRCHEMKRKESWRRQEVAFFHQTAPNFWHTKWWCSKFHCFASKFLSKGPKWGISGPKFCAFWKKFFEWKIGRAKIYRGDCPMPWHHWSRLPFVWCPKFSTFLSSLRSVFCYYYCRYYTLIIN